MPFDPNQPFQAANDSPAKAKFDPNKPFQSGDSPADQLKSQIVASEKAGGSGNPLMDAYQARHANDTVGQKLKSIVFGDNDNPAIGDSLGAAALAIPGGGSGSAINLATKAEDAGKLIGEAMNQAPEVAQRLASYLGGHGIGPLISRMAVNTGLGAAQGAYANGAEGAKRGAKFGAGLGALGEGIGGLFSLFGKGSRVAGQKLTGVTPHEANAYADNPDLAEKMYDMDVNDPKGLNQKASSEIKAATGKLQNDVIDPLRSDVNLRASSLPGVRVNPAQYEGTAAGDEINRAWNTQGNSTDLDIPVDKSIPIQKVDINPTFSNPSKQDVYDYNIPYRPVEVQTYEVGYKPEAQDAGSLFVPQGSQSVSIPKPVPDSMSLTGPQALAAKRAASAASDISGKPLNYSPADNELAEKNAAAASNLRSALESMDPQIANDDSEISDLIQKKQAALNLNNPSRIYYSGDSIGSVPVRDLQQSLDEATGSNFRQQADALAGGKAVMGRANGGLRESGGLVDRLFAQPIGRQLLKRSGLFSAAEDELPIIQNAIRQGLFSSQNDNQ